MEERCLSGAWYSRLAEITTLVSQRLRCVSYMFTPPHPPPSTTSCLSLGVGPGRNPVRGSRFGPFYLLCWVSSWDASGLWSSPPSPQQMGPCLASNLSRGAVAKSQRQRSLFNSVTTWPNCILGAALFL